jgi:rod shape-determining protein MreD
MSWLSLLAALVVAVLLQTTVGRMFDLPVVDVDLLLILALLYGLAGPVRDARIATWIIGLARDLTTDGPVGLHAFAFGLTGLLVTKLREVMNRQVWWARVLIGFLAALPGQLLVKLHLVYIQRGAWGDWWDTLTFIALPSATAAVIAAVLTALPPLAPRRGAAHRAAWGRG